MQEENKDLWTLFGKYLNRTATPEEKQKFEHWFLRLDIFKNSVFIDGNEEEQIRKRIQTNIRERIHPTSTGVISTTWFRAAAATILLCCFSAILYVTFTGNRPQTFTYSSGDEMLKNVLLPDGTSVSLNTHSTLEYTAHYNTRERRVVLTGEGYFDVKSDKQKPFIVQTGAVETNVLGTAFNIESYPDEQSVRVSLLRGKVRVTETGSHEQIALLTPGYMMEFNKHDSTHRTTPAALAHPESWMDGNINFNNIALADALLRIERQYHIAIQVDQAWLSGKTVTTQFKNTTSWQTVLGNILFVHDLEYTVADNTVRIRQTGH